MCWDGWVLAHLFYQYLLIAQVNSTISTGQQKILKVVIKNYSGIYNRSMSCSQTYIFVSKLFGYGRIDGSFFLF